MKKIIPAAALILLVFLGLFYARQLFTAPLEIHFIDVGEGDALFIRTPDGYSGLVDSGPVESVSKITDVLKHHAVKTLDFIITTHPHADHLGGLMALIRQYPVRKIYDHGQDLASLKGTQYGELAEHYQTQVRQKSSYHIMRTGDTINAGSVTIEVLWPPKGDFSSRDFNINSMVLRIRYGKSAVLLMGDLMMGAENELLLQKADLRAEIIKIGHHGSRFATGEELLERVAPQAAVISAASGKPDKPHPWTLEKLAQRNIKIYRTDREGTLCLLIKPNGTWNMSREK